jgi:uncharacterized protein (DUF2225 family)
MVKIETSTFARIRSFQAPRIECRIQFASFQLCSELSNIAHLTSSIETFILNHHSRFNFNQTQTRKTQNVIKFDCSNMFSALGMEQPESRNDIERSQVINKMS